VIFTRHATGKMLFYKLPHKIREDRPEIRMEKADI
jgi:hypothetical protein